jgi:hypothetical protein
VHKLYLQLYTASLILIGIIIALLTYLRPTYTFMQQDFWACFIFYGLLSPAIYFFSMLGIRSDKNTDFLKFFYGSFMLKLFLSLIFVMIYLSICEKIKIHFIAAFGLCYFVFSGIETFCLMNASKSTNKK